MEASSTIAKVLRRLRNAPRSLRHMPRSVAGWRSRKAGDAAFQRCDWTAAVALYETALARDPHMAPVWTFLGWAQVKAGDTESASRSFAKAASLEPDDPQPYRELSRVALLQGDRHAAAEHLLAVLERTPRDFHALVDFVEALPPGDRRAALLDRARCLTPYLPQDPPQTPRPPARLMLDVTELMLWYRKFRLPSGVQRVQIGLITALLADRQANAAACVFDGTGWKVADPAAMLRVLELSQSGGDREEPEWRDALLNVHLGLSGSGPAGFGPDTVMSSLGSWVTNAFMDAIDAVKRSTGASYVPLIYDLIPFLHPDWFPPGVAEDFPRWLDRLMSSADAYVTISESTRHDLIRLSGERGHGVDPALVTVMALDADCRSRSAARPDADALPRYGVSARDYVLFVATIEPRKNHVTALRAWRTLLAERPGEAVPTLVFVGHSGWKNEEVHQLLAQDAQLRSRVKILSGVPDDDLGTLYANARFILFPSFYEGWGLPVTEALCYGRTAVVARNSSLTEAGGSFVEYFDAADVDALVMAAGRLIGDDDYLAEREQHIARHFAPRAWRDLGADLERAAAMARASRARMPAKE